MARGQEAIAARGKLVRLTKEIVEREASIGRDLWEMGMRLNTIHEEQLWQAGGHPSFDAYCRAELGITARTASRFMRVASHFSGALAARYKRQKLEAILRYESVTPVAERPGDLGSAEIRLRGEDGRFYSKSLHEASALEIDEASALLEEAKRGRQRIPQAFTRRVERLVAALPAAPAGLSGRQRARVSRGRDGRLALSFSAIPADELDAFVAALQEHLMGS